MVVIKGCMFVIGISGANSGVMNIYNQLRNIHFDIRIYSIDFVAGKGKKTFINGDSIWLEWGLL